MITIIDISEEKVADEREMKKDNLQILQEAQESEEESSLVKTARRRIENIEAVEAAGGAKLFRILLENNFSFSVVRFSGSYGGPAGLFDLALFLEGKEMETSGWMTMENINRIIESFVPLPQYEEWNKGKLKKLFKMLIREKQREKAEELLEQWLYWGSYKQQA